MVFTSLRLGRYIYLSILLAVCEINCHRMQYSFFVPHDMAHLIELMGGNVR